MTLLLGFLIGLATPIVLDLYRDARSKQGRVELMKAERVHQLEQRVRELEGLQPPANSQ